MTELQVHRINFFEPEPKPIRCICYDKKSRLAISRADSSVEIWNVECKAFLEKALPPLTKGSIESLAWCKGRLFSAGLDGYVREHDLNGIFPKYEIFVVPSYNMPVWCLCANKAETHIAIGDEDGTINLYEVSPEDLVFHKRLVKQEGAVLCLDWHENGETIVTGSVDTIRVWSVETGRVVNRIILSRTTKNTPTVVWCIAILRDATIISGDSCGKISFWNSILGTLISTSGNQKEDILAITVHEKEEAIYTSGVDPTITMHMKSHSNGRWMKSNQRVVHTHDVRSLQLTGEYLVSGGDDCSIVFTKYPPKTTIKYFPFCQANHISVAHQVSCILLRYPNHLDLWGIGKHCQVEDGQETPVHLLQLNPREYENIITSGISPNGKWLAYSTQLGIKIHNIIMDSGSVVPRETCPVPTSENMPVTSSCILFSSDSSRLLLHEKSVIFVVKCDSHLSNVEKTFNEDSDSEGRTRLFALSPKDTYLACGSANGAVIVYDMKSHKVHCKLPKYKFQPTAMKFDSTSENLVVAYSDRKIIEYDISKLCYTNWSKQQILEEFSASFPHPIMSICFLRNKVLFQDETAVYSFDRLYESLPPKKRTKRLGDSKQVSIAEAKYSTLSHYEHVSFMDTIEDELVVVELSSNHLIRNLPPPIYKKKFGT